MNRCYLMRDASSHVASPSIPKLLLCGSYLKREQDPLCTTSDRILSRCNNLNLTKGKLNLRQSSDQVLTTKSVNREINIAQE